MTEDANYGPLFFLGAGASVAAGVPATFELVDFFLKEMKDRNETKHLEFCEKILKVLKESELGKDGIDVELLLETIDQLENVSDCIPLNFFKKGECILGEDFESKAAELRKKLQDFIKKKGLIEKNDVKYLRDLLMFTEANPFPLDVFSVNYDICIEQFCDANEKKYVDGFYLGWEPKSLERDDVDIRLYKIHGSIIWYETDKGSLVKLPVKSEAAEIDLTTGERATALMLYPKRKLEYSEPLMDLLMRLIDKLSQRDFVFVIGYSFRDSQIQRIFWNAAKKNKKLCVFLVTPSAYEIYEKKLRKYNYTLGTPSDLEERVICLPYKFEKALPFLSEYLRNANNGLGRLGEERKSEILNYQYDYQRCLRPLIYCEHIPKIKEIIKKGAWEDFVGSNPTSNAIELAFKAFLTSIVSNDDSYRKAWVDRLFDLLTSVFENFKIEVLAQKINKEKTDLHIKPLIENELDLKKFYSVLSSMVNDCNVKIKLVESDSSQVFSKIATGIKNFIEKLNALAQSFEVKDYIQLRKAEHPDETEKIRSLNLKEVYGGRDDISDIVHQIERSEFVDAYSTFRSIFNI